MCYNCVDRHEEKGLAMIFESAMTGESRSITYKEMKDEVMKLSCVMRKLGVGRGDRVVIYMP